MSRFTTEIRFICETAAGLMESKGFNSLDEILTKAAPVVFDFDFPVYDELYRLPLEIKILRHFYTREISEETVGLWKLRLCDKLNMIMPYYNQLYTSATYTYNPLYNVDTTREHDTTGNTAMTAEITNSTSTSGTTSDKFSDTPQGGLISVEDGTYLTTARVVNDGNDSNGKSNENRDVDTTEKYVEHVTGKQGTESYSSMIKEYRETLLNIDEMLIEELEPLFFGLWE